MLLRRYHDKGKVKSKKKNVILSDLTVKELKEEARHRNLEGYSTLNKEELIELIEGE